MSGLEHSAPRLGFGGIGVEPDAAMESTYVCAHYGPASHAYLSIRLRAALSHDA